MIHPTKLWDHIEVLRYLTSHLKAAELGNLRLTIID
jgi:hypothetical protein